jgi:hypothetical protein
MMAMEQTVAKIIQTLFEAYLALKISTLLTYFSKQLRRSLEFDAN